MDDLMQANGQAPPTAPDVRFRPGKGGEMPHEWAAYMLELWWTSRNTKLMFADAIRTTATHFMVAQED